MDIQKFCLRWNNHQSNMIKFFGNLLQDELMADVTLACDGASLKAHKVILSASSPFFHDIFMNNPCSHPVVILKDVSFSNLQTVVSFIYNGQVEVSQSDLTSLLKTAEALKIKGLSDIDQSNQSHADRSSVDQTESRLGKSKKIKMSNQNIAPRKQQRSGSNFPMVDQKMRSQVTSQPEFVDDVKLISEVKDQPSSPPLEILEPDYNMDFMDNRADIGSEQRENMDVNQSTEQSNSSENIIEDDQSFKLSLGISMMEKENSYAEIENSQDASNSAMASYMNSSQLPTEFNVSTEQNSLSNSHDCSPNLFMTTGIDDVVSSGGKYNCHQCCKSFKNKQNLRRHRQTAHSELRLHKCQICHSAFKRSDILKVHMIRVHEGNG